jgi:hypothetical protein
VGSEQNPRAGICETFSEYLKSIRAEKFSLPSGQASICSINTPPPRPSPQYSVSFAVGDTRLAVWTVHSPEYIASLHNELNRRKLFTVCAVFPPNFVVSSQVRLHMLVEVILDRYERKWNPPCNAIITGRFRSYSTFPKLQNSLCHLILVLRMSLVLVTIHVYVHTHSHTYAKLTVHYIQNHFTRYPSCAHSLTSILCSVCNTRKIRVILVFGFLAATVAPMKSHMRSFWHSSSLFLMIQVSIRICKRSFRYHITHLKLTGSVEISNITLKVLKQWYCNSLLWNPEVPLATFRRSASTFPS